MHTPGDALLNPLVEGADESRAAFRRRRDEYDYVKIGPDDTQKFTLGGWELHKKLQASVWMKKRKSVEQLLEDRIWVLFYRMGYPVLSGKSFRLNYKNEEGLLGTKKIGVFAKDSETAIVVECSARESLGKRNIQKNIEEIETLQKALAQSIRSHFGKGFRPKIIWIFATANIVWTEKDAERADAANLKVVTENELQYFEAFISHIGTAGRHQFLAEFLEGQEIPNLSDIKIPAVRGNFGKHAYYSFVISARHLLKIAFVNHQALNHPDGRPAYQRMINKSRIKDIGTFIQKGGFFPTNILVNFAEACRFDLLSNKENSDRSTKFGWLYLPSKYKSAWIIDGQHRLYGFSNIPDQFLDTNLFVLAFERMDTKTEADLFITINHEQRSVSKSLLVTLQADLKLGSGDPKEALGAVASALVRNMNADNTSPFFRRFETPGVTPQETQNLTVAEAVKGLLRSNLIGRVLPKKTKAVGFLSAQTDQETIQKARKILNGYFRGIMDANNTRWQKGRTAYICVNPGVRAHLMLVQEILHHLSGKGIVDPAADLTEKISEKLVEFIEPLRAFIAKASDAEVEAKFSRKFGEGGVLEYFYNLCEILNYKHKDFGNEEFKKYKARQVDARIQKADQDITDIQHAVSEAVVETLKKLHGTHELPSGEKAYWDLGIENAEIKQGAYHKQQMAPAAQRVPKEAYLDFIDFEKIIKQSNNWPVFEPIFSIPLPDEQRNKNNMCNGSKR